MTEDKKFIAKITFLEGPSTVTGTIFKEPPPRAIGYYKNTIGADFYRVLWDYPEREIKFTFVIADLNIEDRFKQLKKEFSRGAKGVIIIIDFSRADCLPLLEEWLFETVLSCGNIPIVLLREKRSAMDSETLSAFNELLSEKQHSWNLRIQVWDMEEKNSDFFSQLFNFLSREILIRFDDSSQRFAIGTFLSDLKEKILDDPDVLLLTNYLQCLSHLSMKLTNRFLQILSIQPIKRIIRKQKVLSGIFRLLNTIRSISPTLATSLIQQIAFNQWMMKLKHEQDLSEIIAFLDEFRVICPECWERFKQKLSKKFIVTMIARIWYEVKIEAYYIHSYLMEFFSSDRKSEDLPVEIIRLISNRGLEENVVKTKYFIGTLLVFLFPEDSKSILSIINRVPAAVKKIIRKNMQKVTNAELDEDIFYGVPLYQKKKAMREELFFGLSTVELIISTLEQFSPEKKLLFLEKLTVETLSREIAQEYRLERLIQLLKTISAINNNYTLELIRQIRPLLVERLKVESSIILIRQFLECLEEIAPLEMREILNAFTLEALVQKMIFYYADLDIENLDIPNLSKIAFYLGSVNPVAEHLFHQLLIDIPQEKIYDLLVLLIKFVKVVKNDSTNKQLSESLMEDILNFFIKDRLEELQNFIGLLLRSFPIKMAAIKEAFLSQLRIEESQQISYEQQKLLAFIQNL
ncbi:MAG: hypothetical protein K9W42_12440 [Candidatus Heimdallarchaeota archaeon]|nr:hypothetical protein [Candidatus Heimdallarchaeota archaeon]